MIGDGTYLGHDVHVHAIDAVRIGDGCVLAEGAYVTTSRGLEGPAMGYYGLLDRTPKGRQDSDRVWLRRHDEYED